MQLRPGQNEPQLPAAERAVYHLKGVDLDLRRTISCAGVEMRWLVVVVEHRDHNPQETADRRHAQIIPATPVSIRWHRATQPTLTSRCP